MPQLPTYNFESVECLYTKYSRHAYAFALKVLGFANAEAAEDLVHEAFIRFYKNPQSFDPARGPFINWFLTVVRNLCLDYLHRKSIIKFVSLNTTTTVNWEETLLDEKMVLEEEVWVRCQRIEIMAALQTITSEQRVVIELAFFQGLSHSQIALKMDQSIGTVKTRIRLGLLKLKTHLETSKNSNHAEPQPINFKMSAPAPA